MTDCLLSVIGQICLEVVIISGAFLLLEDTTHSNSKRRRTQKHLKLNISNWNISLLQMCFVPTVAYPLSRHSSHCCKAIEHGCRRVLNNIPQTHHIQEHNIINIAWGSGKSPVPFTENLLCVIFCLFIIGKMLTIETNSSNLESKLLVAVAKVCWSHIYNREQLCRGGVNL